MSVIEQTRETVVAPVTRREVLHRAAYLLEEFGWQQGGYGSCATGSMCLIGAINQAVQDLRFPLTSEYVSLRAVEDVFFRYFADTRSVTTWNDTPGRTKAEVVARLREAAESA